MNKYGLEISGSSGIKKHIISLMDYILSLFLSNLSDNGNKDTIMSTILINKSLYESQYSKTTDKV